MQATFKQKRPDKNITEKESFRTNVIFSIVAVVLGILLIKMGVNPLLTLIIMVVLIVFGRPFFKKYYGDFAKTEDIIGLLKFDNNSVTWSNGNQEESIEVSEISRIDLRFNFIQGKQFAYRDIIHNGLVQIHICTKAEQSIELKFLIETKDQLNDLKPIWKTYYKRGIRIREVMGNENIKTILLEKNSRSFEVMQALKRELNVDGF